MKKIYQNIYYLFFPLFIGGIVGFLIKNHIDYTSLVKPPLAPPKLTFPIFWTIIYILMGISYFIYRKEQEDKETVTLYYSQLFVNALWSILFFVFKLRFISVIWIVLLDLLVFKLFALLKEKNKLSAYLNIIYIIWIIFATYLTIGIYILN